MADASQMNHGTERDRHDRKYVRRRMKHIDRSTQGSWEQKTLEPNTNNKTIIKWEETCKKDVRELKSKSES